MSLLQYATVKPYCGWYEAERLLRPYLMPCVAGFGFYLALYATRQIEDWLGAYRRGGMDRREP